MDLNRAKKGELPSIPIISLVQSKYLLIQVLKRLSNASMSPNLLIFKDTKNEDLSSHIEYFIKILIIWLITNGCYYLILF